MLAYFSVILSKADFTISLRKYGLRSEFEINIIDAIGFIIVLRQNRHAKHALFEFSLKIRLIVLIAPVNVLH